MAADPDVILVAGANYPEIKETGRNSGRYVLKHGLSPGEFAQLSLRYARAISALRDRTRFTIFDFYNGIVARFDGRDLASLTSASDNAKVVKFEQSHMLGKQFQPLDRLNYFAIVKGSGQLQPMSAGFAGNLETKKYLRYFEGNQQLRARTVEEYTAKFSSITVKRSLSATDLYEYIADGSLLEVGYTGSGPPSIAELHFFSHSFFQGPILVNTSDFSESTARFDGDRDCREAKDFTEANMPERTAFQKSFRKDAFCVIWGCDGARPISEPMRQALRQVPAFAFDSWSFQLRYTAEMDFPDEKTFHEWYGGRNRVSSWMTYRRLAEILRKVVGTATYAQSLAKASDVVVYAMPPGASSDYDANRKQKSIRLMHYEGQVDLMVCKFYYLFLGGKLGLSKRIGDVTGDFDELVERGYLSLQ